MPTPSGHKTSREIRTTRKMRWWYESLVDFILVHPTATHQEMADHFKKSLGTIEIVVHTDAFKSYYAQRRAEYNEHHNHAIQSKITNVAEKSMELMLDSLEKKKDTIPLELLTRINESALRSLGYGEKAGPQVVVNNNNNSSPQLVPVAVSVQDLEEARAALRRSQGFVSVQQQPEPLMIEHDNTEKIGE